MSTQFSDERIAELREYALGNNLPPDFIDLLDEKAAQIKAGAEPMGAGVINLANAIRDAGGEVTIVDARTSSIEGYPESVKAALEKPAPPAEPSSDTVFIDHIQSHLGIGEVVVCKICGRAAKEICGDKPAPPEGE